MEKLLSPRSHLSAKSNPSFHILINLPSLPITCKGKATNNASLHPSTTAHIISQFISSVTNYSSPYASQYQYHRHSSHRTTKSKRDSPAYYHFICYFVHCRASYMLLFVYFMVCEPNMDSYCYLLLFLLKSLV